MQADQQSVIHAIRALDTEQKGYFDFKAFSKKMGPGTSDRIAKFTKTEEQLEEITHLPEVGGPSQNALKVQMKKGCMVS